MINCSLISAGNSLRSGKRMKEPVKLSASKFKYSGTKLLISTDSTMMFNF